VTGTVVSVLTCVRKDRLIRGWSVLLVLLVVGTSWLWWQNRQADAIDEARAEALAEARTKVASVLSYNHRTVEADIAASAEYLTGDAKRQFEATTAQWVVPASLDAEITNTAEVVDAGVVSATEDRVETLVFVTQITVSKATDEPKISGSRLAVTMTREGDSWLISVLDPIGSEGSLR
jgi:Mce-associated membrane protein